MARRGWITGDISAPVSNYVYRVVRLPSDQMLIAAFNGALAELGFASNWEQGTGLQTPEEAAEIMRDLLVSLQDSGEIDPMNLPRMARVRYPAAAINNGTVGVLQPSNIDQYSHVEYRDAIETDPMRLRLPEVGYYLVAFNIVTAPNTDQQAISGALYDAALSLNVLQNIETYNNPAGANLGWVNQACQPFYNETPNRELTLLVTGLRAGGGQTTIDASRTFVHIANFGDITFLTA